MQVSFTSGLPFDALKPALISHRENLTGNSVQCIHLAQIINKM